MTRKHPRSRVVALVAACVMLAACDDPADPSAIPDVEVEASAAAFPDTDPGVGTDEVILVEIRNDGGGQLTISDVALEGPDASAFAVEASTPMFLGSAQVGTVRISFQPESEGVKSATVAVLSDDPQTPRVEITVTGQAARFQYRQVDRVGIPGLNTVFNHPSGMAGFDKTAYNVAAPSGDVAGYSGQFEVVLGAVGNADPAATAALLLPDELPVDMGAATTSFAQLTGRALADDAVDVALFVTVGEPSLQSDNVDANDRAFRGSFPYVAEPHQ